MNGLVADEIWAFLVGAIGTVFPLGRFVKMAPFRVVLLRLNVRHGDGTSTGSQITTD